MTYEPNPDSNGVDRLVIVASLIVASAIITALGVEWRRVDRELVRTAVAQMTAAQNEREDSQSATTAAQDGREIVQNVREEEQNTRDDNQDSREAGQNTRQSGQNERQVQQDARDEGMTQ